MKTNPTLPETISKPAGLTAKVEAALALDPLSIRYRVELRPDEASEFCRLAPAYNEFSEDDLVRLIDRINKIVPPMEFGDCNGNPNPNNGKPHHRFLVGNEGSRVIYLEIQAGYLRSFKPGPNSPWQTIPTFNGLSRTLQRYATAAHADEFSAEQEEHAWTFRFWWD